MPESETRLRAQIAAHTRWANTSDRTSATAPGRAAFEQKFLDLADGDPVRAEHLRRAHFLRLALKSAKSRRKIKEARAELIAAEAELEAAGGGTDAA
jgi:hypothetical protein